MSLERILRYQESSVIEDIFVLKLTFLRVCVSGSKPHTPFTY